MPGPISPGLTGVETAGDDGLIAGSPRFSLGEKGGIGSILPVAVISDADFLPVTAAMPSHQRGVACLAAALLNRALAGIPSRIRPHRAFVARACIPQAIRGLSSFSRVLLLRRRRADALRVLVICGSRSGSTATAMTNPSCFRRASDARRARFSCPYSRQRGVRRGGPLHCPPLP